MFQLERLGRVCDVDQDARVIIIIDAEPEQAFIVLSVPQEFDEILATAREADFVFAKFDKLRVDAVMVDGDLESYCTARAVDLRINPCDRGDGRCGRTGKGGPKMKQEPTPGRENGDDMALEEMRNTARNRVEVQVRRWKDYRRQQGEYQRAAAQAALEASKMIPTIPDQDDPPPTGQGAGAGGWKRPKV